MRSAGRVWLGVLGPAALLGLLVGVGAYLGVLYTDDRAPAPPPLAEANAAELLAGHSSDWRVVVMREQPQVYVIEFPDLAEQGATMNRVAALLEKVGAPRDRVLDDAAMQQLIARSHDTEQTFYEGHDYRAAGLAKFFALVRQQGIRLRPQEERLQQLLLAIGLLVERDGQLQPGGEQALVTFSATQPDDPRTPIDESMDEVRRESVLQHELSHGEFFTRPAYRQQCWDFWRNGLNEAERQRWRELLASLDYDPADEELLVNETQALLMHTADRRAFRAETLGVGEAELEDQRRRFRRAGRIGLEEMGRP